MNGFVIAPLLESLIDEESQSWLTVDNLPQKHIFLLAYCVLSSFNYILLRTAAILYLLLHNVTHLYRLCDCESFGAGQVHFEKLSQP